MTSLWDLADVISADLVAVGPAVTSGGAAEAGGVVTGIDLSAQRIRPGDLFAALPGARAHGAAFTGTALERGAVAVLTDTAGVEAIAAAGFGPVPVLVHPDPRSALGVASATVYGHPSERMQVIGITGTSGKTTTSYLVEAGLNAAGRVTGLVGTVETRIAGQRVPSALTTPEAPQLHALFATMLEHGVDTVVMEVSSHALALGRVAATEFAVGGFTNLSQDHLDFHKDLDDYFAAKARLFAPDSPVHARRAVVCVDDEWGTRMAEIARAVNDGDPAVVRTVSSDETGSTVADWTVTDVASDPAGTQEFSLTDPAGIAHRVSVRLPGRYNVANASLAIALCSAVGVDVDVAARGIGSVESRVASSASTADRSSSRSSITRTNPQRSRPSSPPCDAARRDASPSSSARAVIATAGSVRSWVRLRHRQNSSSSPTTILGPRTLPRFAPQCSRAPTRSHRTGVVRSGRSVTGLLRSTLLSHGRAQATSCSSQAKVTSVARRSAESSIRSTIARYSRRRSGGISAAEARNDPDDTGSDR